VSDATETPIAPCPLCGSKAGEQWVIAAGDYLWHVRCENNKCDTRGPKRRSLKEAISVWNRRTFFHPSPLASTLAAYMIDGDTTALQVAKDVVMEMSLWEQAEEELDRPLTIEDAQRMGFVRYEEGSDYRWISGTAVVVFPSARWDGSPQWETYPVIPRNNEIKTLRQFLHLCGLFGISPSP
jgi:hypothetical protein